MKNLIKYTLAALFLGTAITSCERDFDEINTDNSRILNPTAGSMLVPAEYELSSYAYRRANDFTFDIMQVSLDFPNEGNSLSRYYITENTGNGYWNNSYTWLKQLKEMHDLAASQGNKNYEAISTVLSVWAFANLTDTFGDIPYSEALSLDTGVTQPKFDRQKEIYISMLDNLKAANAMFDTTKALTEGDLIYKADSDVAGILKWKKFCNTLSLRLLTRILKRNGEVNVYERIQEIVNNPTVYPLMQSNADTAGLDISGVAPLLPPIARPQDFTTGRAAAEFFVETLKANNDPRMAAFFSQAKSLPQNQNIGYKGAPSGYAPGTSFNYQPSNMNQNLAKAPLKILLLPYAELQFILAELSLKGIITGNAQTYYEAGVKSTIEQWNAVLPANYFANPKVAYDGTLERIMLQKYVALFFVDQQQWYEKRRTGFPVLPNNGGLLNGGKFPQRLMYPTQPKILNAANYQQAVTNIGGDNINTVNWWNQ